MANTNKTRVGWIDVYKGMLIIFVVLGHSLQEIYTANQIDFTTSWFRNIIYSFHMPAFMAMSGYLVYRINAKYDIIEIIKKRFLQLIVPLLLWTGIMAFVKDSDYIDLILYPNNGYWFLWALFFIIMLFNVVNYICEKTHTKQELGMFLTVIALIILQLAIPDPKFLGYEYIAYYFPFYIMGYYANKYKDRLPKSLILVCALFILWFIMACYWTPNDLPFFLEKVKFIPSKLLQMMYRISVPVIFVIAMYLLAPRLEGSDSGLWKILVDIGQISLGIYLVHMVIKRYLTTWLISSFDSLPMACHIAIEFILLTILSVAIVKLIQKWRFSNKWLLGRF